MAKGKMGRIYRRKNSTHEFGSSTEHYWVRVENESGDNERWLRLSMKDIEWAEQSAAKNMEDAPPVGFITNLLD